MKTYTKMDLQQLTDKELTNLLQDNFGGGESAYNPGKATSYIQFLIDDEEYYQEYDADIDYVEDEPTILEDLKDYLQ